MRDRAAPLILLMLAGVIVALSDEPLRGAAAVTLFALIIPAWRSDVAGWYTALSVSAALALGVTWYGSDSTVRAWAFAMCAVIIAIPLLAEALAEAVEEHGEPPTPWHRLARAILIALSPGHGGSYDEGSTDR